MSADTPDVGLILERVLDQHRLVTRTSCGAVSMPVVHHHGGETDARPGPRRVLKCSQDAGHDELHKDAVCCWHFQTFEDWQVVERSPRTFDACSSCHTSWPCETILAAQAAVVA